VIAQDEATAELVKEITKRQIGNVFRAVGAGDVRLACGLCSTRRPNPNAVVQLHMGGARGGPVYFAPDTPQSVLVQHCESEHQVVWRTVMKESLAKKQAELAALKRQQERQEEREKMEDMERMVREEVEKRKNMMSAAGGGDGIERMVKMEIME